MILKLLQNYELFLFVVQICHFFKHFFSLSKTVPKGNRGLKNQ